MFARTERLLLRPGWVDDAPALAAALGDEGIVRNLARAPWPYGLAEAESFLARPPHDLPDFLVFLRGAGAPRLVGGCGLGRTDDGAIEIGYWIARPFWGLGFATEAARQVMDIAHTLRLPPLVAGHFVDNPASGSVLRKLGFRSTGRIAPRACPARGRAVPCLLYAEGVEEEVDPVMRRNGARPDPSRLAA